MKITHITDPGEVAARFGDARRPENRLPWQSVKLGIDLFVSDQSGCVFLIVRHDPGQPPSRLVRAFFRNAPNATVAVVKCGGEAERTALLTPIQNTIAASLEDDEKGSASSPANVIDLDAPKSRMAGERDAMGFHAVRSFFLASEQEFREQFVSTQLIKGGMGGRSTSTGVMVLAASAGPIYTVALVRVHGGQSWRHPFVRQVFKKYPNAYGWVVAFDDELLRDTFAAGIQQKVSELPPGDDNPDDDFQWPVHDWPGGGDAGVPVVTIRPTPTRSGSAAEEFPEEEPEFFFIGPTELAETPTEGELVPARVTK